MVLRASLTVDQLFDAKQRGAAQPATRVAPRPLSTTSVSADPSGQIDVPKALRSLHLLLRCERLYDQNHPHRLDSLDAAYDALRVAAAHLSGLELRIERGGIVAPKISESGGRREKEKSRDTFSQFNAASTTWLSMREFRRWRFRASFM